MNPTLKQQWIDKLRNDPPESLHRGSFFAGDTIRICDVEAKTCAACAFGKLIQLIGPEKFSFNVDCDVFQFIRREAQIDITTELRPIVDMNDHYNASPNEIADYIEKNL